MKTRWTPALIGNPRKRPNARLLRRATSLLWVVVIAILLAFAFFASSLCITFFLAGLLAILADPIPTYLERWRVPRLVSSALVVVSGMVVLGFVIYASSGKVSTLMDHIPEYAERIREVVKPISQSIERLQKSAGTLAQNTPPRKVPEVRINEPANWPSYLVRGVGTVWGAVIIAGVVPFLMFFMLVRKRHLYTWLSNAFGALTDVDSFATRLTQMVRGFVIGNLAIAGLMAACTAGVLLALKLQGALALGIASGLLNLIPFLGAILAAMLPLAAATLQFGTVGPLIIIFVTVISLHLISANLLIPKFIGSRVNIGPVAATMGMLFWGWLWGVTGLLLAVPLTALVKLIADCHPSLIHISNLLAESPRSIPDSVRTGFESAARAIPLLRLKRPAKNIE